MKSSFHKLEIQKGYSLNVFHFLVNFFSLVLLIKVCVQHKSLRCTLRIVMISNHGIGTLENLKSNFHKLEIQKRLLIIFFLFFG